MPEFGVDLIRGGAGSIEVVPNYSQGHLPNLILVVSRGLSRNGTVLLGNRSGEAAAGSGSAQGDGSGNDRRISGTKRFGYLF